GGEPVKTVVVCVHTGRDDALDLGRSIANWFSSRGHRVLASTTDISALVADPHTRIAADSGDEPVDLVISIGGDGTMLRASRRAVAGDAHVFGMNLGRLGYLAEVEPDKWQRALERYVAGEFSVAERLLLASDLRPAGTAPSEPAIPMPSALNEVVIEKKAKGRT